MLPNLLTKVQNFCLWVLVRRVGGKRIESLGPLMKFGVSESNGVSPTDDEILLLRQKDPKPLTPRLASLRRGGTPTLRRADQLARLKQGPLADKSVPP